MFRNLFVVASIVVLPGCASITASRSQTLMVASNPAGAAIHLNGQPVGVTPMAIEVPRSSYADVQVVAGGEAQKCQVGHTIGGGYLVADVALCVFLFPLGCLSFIDAGGAWNELDRSSCSVALPAATAKASPAGLRSFREPLPAKSVAQTGCVRDTDCKGSRVCSAGVCVGCTKDSDCSGNLVCSKGGVCKRP